MSSEQASDKKRLGHRREEEFARAIGGEVNKGAPTDKKDVIDKRHRTYSVKGGTWWQIFLYRRSRLLSNTIFQGLGNLTSLLIECIDVFPGERSDYLSDKGKYKVQLQGPMQKLKSELEKKEALGAFLSKGLFNGGEVDYLAVMEGNEKFHIFDQKHVVKTLLKVTRIENSKAASMGQYDAQKILFKHEGRNFGEIEVRNDSDIHYKEIKCRFNGVKVLDILRRWATTKEEARGGDHPIFRYVSSDKLSEQRRTSG